MLAEIVETVGELLDVGWQKIRIVTDHGWLLTPTPMAKVELPKHLTETRWGRCAVIKDSMDSGYQQVGWFWNNAVSIAMAPGASSFIAGRYYDHGGLSLQECLTPVIAVRKNPSLVTNVTASATLSDLRWLGLTCKIKAQTDSKSIVAVLRTHAGDESTEITKRKPLKDGMCNLMVDDHYENTTAVLVLLDGQGNVLAKQPTIIGNE